MKTFIIVLFWAISPFLLAQTDSLYVSTEVDNTIYSFDFKIAKKAIFDFLKSNNVLVVTQNANKTSLKINFVSNTQTYLSFDSLLNTLGYSNSKKVKTISNFNKYQEINLEISFLKQKKDSYSELLKKIDEKSENYLSLWNEQKSTEEKIFNKERELIHINKKENSYSVTLALYDEATTPESTGISFVNMPGFEYSYLNIESTKRGVSARNYKGYFLKYLFTRGKSFATIGVYKNNDIDKSDSTAFSEMFVIGLGQDYYSRHLGRGSRKFFNLYSGYSIGGILGTGKKSKANTFFISPTIGLEIFKNKFFLIDSKANYFLPLANNRNLRGFSYNLSFNFVF
jgi:hypothetical protein